MSEDKIIQYCTFKVDENVFGIPVLDVQEVIKPQKISRIPLANEQTRGLINLRGQIVTLIGLRQLFGLEGGDETVSMNVVVKSNDSLSALIVDEVYDVVDLSMESFEKIPATLDAKVKTFSSGIHKLTSGLLIVLDLNKILDF